MYYLLDKYEINAYISQLSKLVQQKKFKSNEEFLEGIQQLSTYKSYKKLYKEALKSNSIFSSFYKKLIFKTWKKLINHTYLAYIETIEKDVKENKSFKYTWLYDFDENIPVWKRIRL